MMYTKALAAAKRKAQSDELDDDIHSDTSGSDDGSDFSENERLADDSDEELQRKFEAGDLKPGTYKRIAEPRKPVNDVEAMEVVLKNFSRADMPWIERVDLTVKPASGPENNDDAETVHDDFKRELEFYRIAQSGVLQGMAQLHRLGIPTQRPKDYFAQMLKSDNHMQKVRTALIQKSLQIEKSTKAKKLRELKKMGKKIQTEVMLSRQDAKRNMLKAVKRFQKGHKDRMQAGDLDEILEKSNKTNRKPSDKTKVNRKRNWKNEKYGYGGQKKRGKWNTADSSADVSKYFDEEEGGKRGRRGKPGRSMVKNQRPGKSKRQAMKKR